MMVVDAREFLNGKSDSEVTIENKEQVEKIIKKIEP